MRKRKASGWSVETDRRGFGGVSECDRRGTRGLVRAHPTVVHGHLPQYHRSQSCRKACKQKLWKMAAALHHLGPPPQLQGESWQGVRGPGDAWRGKHTGSFSLGHVGLWVPCWVLSTNPRRVCCVTFCHSMRTCLGRGWGFSTWASGSWHPDCHSQAPTHFSYTKPQG